MKWFSILASSTLMVLFNPAYGGESSAPIVISVNKTPFKVGEEIDLIISLKNVSDHDITTTFGGAPGHAERDYEIRVFSEDGALQPMTPYGRDIYYGTGLHAGGAAGLLVKPGDEHDDYINLNKLYELSQPGKYLVFVSHDLLNVVDEHTLASPETDRSNLLEIVIVK